MNTKLQKMAHPEWVAPSDLDLDLLEKFGFIDQSYRNDICPSFYNYEKRLALFVDYPRDQSEFSDCDWWTQYALTRTNEHGEYLEDIIGTDHFSEVIDFVR